MKFPTISPGRPWPPLNLRLITVVTKIPRWTFEKFPETEDFLTTSMKSVGETMAIGRTFKESLQKAIRSLEIGRFSLLEKLPDDITGIRDFLAPKLRTPNSLRLFYIATALYHGISIDDIFEYDKNRSLVPPPYPRRSSKRSRSSCPLSPTPAVACGRRRPSALQIGGWLRYGKTDEVSIRKMRYEITSCPFINWWTRALPSLRPIRPIITRPTKSEDEARPSSTAQGGHPGRRPQPDRPGH